MAELSQEQTGLGNYFIANYPPFSTWKPAHLADAHAALQRAPKPDTPLGLYLHIPFCRKRCKFCYFRVYTQQNADTIKNYVDALDREVQLLKDCRGLSGRTLRFVYFGGGTPSYLSARQLQTERENGPAEGLNMVVPIDLARPVIDELASSGRTKKPARPWLGLYATEIDGRIAVVGLAERGPAARAGIRTGDVVHRVGGTQPRTLAGFFRACWSLGPAGVMVPMTVVGENGQRNVEIKSADRRDFLKKPKLH